LLIFWQFGVEKLLAWGGVEPMVLDLSSYFFLSTYLSFFLRGENGPSCFAISPTLGQENSSTLQWILNTDIKMWIPGAAATFARVQVDKL